MNKNNAVRRVLIVAGLLIAGGVGSACAEAPAPVSRFYVVEVAPAQDQAFQDGMKAWLKCLHEHADTRGLWAWSAETGDLGRYVFESDTRTWAGIDERNPADKACGGDFNTGVMPHISKAYSWVGERRPKMSHAGMDGAMPAYVYVLDIKVKSGQGASFAEAVEKYAEAAAKIKWEGQWFTDAVTGGGKGSADYILVWPNKSWAEIGQEPNPSIKAMMEKVYGKAQAAAIRKQFFDAIDHQWDGVWSYSKDLSYIPAK